MTWSYSSLISFRRICKSTSFGGVRLSLILRPSTWPVTAGNHWLDQLRVGVLAKLLHSRLNSWLMYIKPINTDGLSSGWGKISFSVMYSSSLQRCEQEDGTRWSHSHCGRERSFGAHLLVYHKCRRVVDCRRDAATVYQPEDPSLHLRFDFIVFRLSLWQSQRPVGIHRTRDTHFFLVASIANHERPHAPEQLGRHHWHAQHRHR